MLNNLLMSLDPQTRSMIDSIYNEAMQSGNPEQFLSQRFGNNPNFQKALNIYKSKTPDEINTYLGNIYNSMKKPTA